MTRRDMGRIALATLPMAKLMAASKPDSNFDGVQIGVITYSFRALPSSAKQILGYCVECGISGVEMMSAPAEAYAGWPIGGGGARVDAPDPNGQRRNDLSHGPARSGGPSPAQQEAAEALRKWRLSVPMDKYKALRKMYNDAGVSLYAFKLPLTLDMPDEECDYAFRVAEALGCNQLTMELPTDPRLTQRVGDFAARHRLMAGYHAHTQATDTLWDTAMSQSRYNGINLDIGHFVAGTGESPIPLIRKHHDRITSLHLKDRKTPAHGGQNVPWGQGDTPIKEVLQLMKREQYKFPASIEYEYNTPAGSTAIAEIEKCLAYAKAALA